MIRRMNYPRATEIRFEEIFGVRFRDYWDGITGFDVIRFDDNVVKSKHNESCGQALERKWGPEAATLIFNLLKSERVSP